MYYGRGRERESSAFIVAICCDYCKATRNVFARQIIYWFLRMKRKYFLTTGRPVWNTTQTSRPRKARGARRRRRPARRRWQWPTRPSRMQANCTLAILQDAKSNSSRQVSFCLEGLVPGCERRAALIRVCIPTQEEGWYPYHLRRHQDWGRYALPK